ncbi:hypothetical protein HAX54_016399 [Datura stramonium]|uniref:Uncharacterized protein n=1 Tax=Datura stramonium TaxID=4076 RepID=A0ABS8UL06_DATST|nr:hypothetical protein [Datura stramonium]
MAKEGIEDWRRKRQSPFTNHRYFLAGVKLNQNDFFSWILSANNRVNIYTENHTFQETRWKSLRSCDLIKVYKDEYFPSDLLSSCFHQAMRSVICYVETLILMETNLKVKHALTITSSLYHSLS